MTRYIRFGIQTENPAGRTPLFANSSKNLPKRMYEKQRVIPIPIWRPVPPRTFREDSETPIRVSMNVDIGYA